MGLLNRVAAADAFARVVRLAVALTGAGSAGSSGITVRRGSAGRGAAATAAATGSAEILTVRVRAAAAGAAPVARADRAGADPDRLLLPVVAAWLREACDCGPGEAGPSLLVESDEGASALATAVPTAEPAPTTAPAIATPMQTCFIVVICIFRSERPVDLGVTLAL